MKRFPTAARLGGVALAAVAVLTTAACGAPGKPQVTTSAPTPVPTLSWSKQGQFPHDSKKFTQGLEVAGDGVLLESAGGYGTSTVSLVTLATGKPLGQVRALPPQQFAEGLTQVNGEVLQLTWREGTVHRWTPSLSKRKPRLSFRGEGWGLCYDENRRVLWRSDGSSNLIAHDPTTLGVRESRRVTRAGKPQPLLNELECVDGQVWANVWKTTEVVRISPATGAVTGVLDLAPLKREAEAINRRPLTAEQVLNGVAYDKRHKVWYFTGKNWPVLFSVIVKN